MTRPRKPAKIPDAAAEARRTNVLLEKLSADFRAFGEGLSAVRERVERIEAKLDSTFDQVGRNTEAIGRVEDQLKSLKADVSELKKDVTEIKDRLQTAEAKLAP